MHAAAGPGEVGAGQRVLARVAVGALVLAPFAIFWRATVGRVLFAPSDAFLYFFPIRVLTARVLRDGELPLWNPFVFSGVPYLGEIQTAVLYPANLLFLVLPALWAMNLQMLTTYSVAALGTYAYARAAGCSVLGAAIGGMVFAFGGFNMGHLAHTGVVQGAAWLPVLLWCLERLRLGGGARWVAGGAAAVAMSVFAGHPQMLFNLLFVGGLYALFGATVGGAPIGKPRFLVLAGATLTAGVLLGAAQILPTGELAAQSVRAKLSFEEFTMLALPLEQLPMMVAPFLFGGVGEVPYWGSGGVPHEMLGYVGLAPLMLVLAALPDARRDRWTWFWLGLAVFAFVMVLGPRTPLAALMYRVPGYNLFRVAGRHFLQFDFALAVLTAWSVTRLASVPRGRVSAAAALVVGAVAAVAALAVSAGERIWGELARQHVGGGFDHPTLADAFAWLSPAIGLPLALALASGASVIGWRRQASGASAALLAIVVTADLATFAALVPHAFPRPGLADEVPAFARVLSEREHQPYRLAMLYAGQHVPARYDLALLGVPLINGYEPLMLSRYSQLTNMTYYGVIGDAVIASQPAVLDQLNARFLAVVQPMPQPIAVGFAIQGLDLELRPGHPVELVLPYDVRATGMLVASAVRGVAPAVGTPVARIRVLGQDGRVDEQLVLMGRHTAAWAGPAASAPPRFEAETEGGATGATYRGRVDWPAPRAVRRVTVEALAPAQSVRLSRLSLIDADADAATPLTRLHALAADPARWESIRTDDGVELLRNRGALPRAWLVPRTIALAPEAMVGVLQRGRLPDGTAFDPRAAALVEGEAGRDFGALDAAASVEVTRYGLNEFELHSRAAGPAFLVVSEMYYTGWEAEIDGAPSPITRTNYLLRGLALPPGEHRIRFTYRPRSVMAGAALSGLTATALLAATVLGRRRRQGRMG